MNKRQCQQTSLQKKLKSAVIIKSCDNNISIHNKETLLLQSYIAASGIKLSS